MATTTKRGRVEERALDYYPILYGSLFSNRLKEVTYIRNHHHFLGYNVVQDEGEGHLIIIV